MPDAHSVFALPVDAQTALDQVADTAGRLGAVVVTRSNKQLVVRWPFIRALGSRTKAGAHVSIDVSAEAPGETQLSVSREYRDLFDNPADDSVRDVSGRKASQLVDAVREQWSGPDGAPRIISRSAPPQRPAAWKLALAVLFFVGGTVAVWLIPAKSTQRSGGMPTGSAAFTQSDESSSRSTTSSIPSACAQKRIQAFSKPVRVSTDEYVFQNHPSEIVQLVSNGNYVVADARAMDGGRWCLATLVVQGTVAGNSITRTIQVPAY